MDVGRWKVLGVMTAESMSGGIARFKLETGWVVMETGWVVMHRR